MPRYGMGYGLGFGSTARSMATLCAVALAAWGWVAVPSHADAQPAPLIDAKGLQKLKSDPALVLLHVGPKPDYDAGHIEGARYITMFDVAVNDSVNKVNLELPTEAELRARLEKLGIGDKSKIVVVFGEDWGSPATRILWTLQVAGLGGQSQLLDGGTLAWKRAGLPLTRTAPEAPTAGKLTVAQNRSLVVDYQWMQSHFTAPHVRLVDGRAPVFYEGPGMKHDGRPDMKAGHLPNAVNIPFNTLVDDSVRVLPVATLRRMFTDAGVQPGDTVAAYCHVGQQATTVLLAARILGHPIRLYDGSMNEWENRKLPLVNTKAPQ